MRDLPEASGPSHKEIKSNIDPCLPHSDFEQVLFRPCDPSEEEDPNSY